MAKKTRNEEWLTGIPPENIDPAEEQYFNSLLNSLDSQELSILKSAVEQNIHPGGLKERIDLANSLKNWPVASDVHTDAQLGRFLYENGLLPEEEQKQATITLNSTFYPEEFLEKTGKTHREMAGGFYTPQGYVENQGITAADIPKDKVQIITLNGGDANLDEQKSEGPIRAYITNLGKYNEGQLVGKWHSFPTTPEEIAATLQEIGIDGQQYEEFFITDYETDVGGIHDGLPEYASLDELNYLAVKLEELEPWEREKYEAIAEMGDYSHSLSDLINLTENLDSFDFMESVKDDSDLGYYWVEDAGVYDLKSMGNLAQYIDYERFGRDIRLEEGGQFVGNGYVALRDSFDDNRYCGTEYIPDEYRVSSLPEKETPDKGTMTVLLVEPEQVPREVTIPHTLDAMQQLVGGMMEAVYPYEDQVALVCNDEGKINGMPLNRALYGEDGKMYDIVAGNFFLCGLGEEDFTTLPPELMEKFSQQFHAPEQFVKLAGQVVAVQMPVEPAGEDKGLEVKPKTDEPER